MTNDELDQACTALFGKPSSGYGVTLKLAHICKCSTSAVNKWKFRGVPGPVAELIRIKVLAKEISER